VAFEKASIIVVSYNNAHLTMGCFGSIFQYTRHPFQLVWIDNGSDPDEFDMVQSYLRGCGKKYIACQLNENRGFIGGTAEGLSMAKGDPIVLLNNDTVVTEGWLTKLVKALEENEKIGIVGPITSTSEELSWQAASNLRAKWIHENIPEEKGSIHDYAKELEEAQRGRVRIMGGESMLAFFCVAMRRKMVDEIGWLDPRFGLGHGDDDDYCLRAHKAGWDLALAMSVYLFHHHRSTFKILKQDWKKIQQENLQKFRDKWGM